MKKIVGVMMILLLTFALVGCSDSSSGASGDDKVVIGLSMNTLNNPFFVKVKEGAEAGAKEAGVELIVTDAQNNVGTQLSDVENLITQKPDLIIIDPTDTEAIVSAVEAANEANIPVMTVDRQSNGGEVVAHVGFDALEAGRLAAKAMVEGLDGKGKIFELTGIMGTNVAQNRHKGFTEYMKDHPEIEIVSSQTANFDRGEGMSVTENLLQAHSDVDGIYGANDEMAIGAIKALEAAGKAGDVVVVGTDDTDPMKEQIKKGNAYATVANPPYFLGKVAIETGMSYLDGEDVEEKVTLDAEIVTKDNVDEVKTSD